MGFVLAESFSWLKHSGEPPFPVVPLQTFAKLREAVNDGTADFFMWEHFTSKRYYDKGEIKKIGEIYTPWSSWKIVARDDKEVGARLPEVFKKLNQGVEYFLCHQEEAVTHISSELDYSREDAREWCIGTVTNTQPCGYYTHRQIRILLHSSYYYVTTITYMNLLQHLGTTYDICCIVPRAKYELTCTSSAPETPRAGRIAPTQTPYSRPDHATYGFGCPSRTYPGRLCWL